MDNNKIQNILIWIILIVNIIVFILTATILIVGWDTLSQKNQPIQKEQSNQTPLIGEQQIIPSYQPSISLKPIQQTPSSNIKIPQEGTTAGKCGDGICGPVEKDNPNACPQDCD